jgi:hypothetical protein
MRKGQRWWVLPICQLLSYPCEPHHNRAQQRKGLPMSSDETVPVTLYVPTKVVTALHQVREQRHAQTGNRPSMSSLLREGIHQLLKFEGVEVSR